MTAIFERVAHACGSPSSEHARRRINLEQKIFEDRKLRRAEREKEDDALLRGRIIAGEGKWTARPSYYEIIDKLMEDRSLMTVENMRPGREQGKERYKMTSDRIIKGLLPAVGDPAFPGYSKQALHAAKRTILDDSHGSQFFESRLEHILDDRFDDPDPAKRLRLLAAAMLYRNIDFDSFAEE